jgi:RimJ/RimL family protein N-acetyltransferase
MIKDPVILETERIRLEPLEARHVSDLVRLCNDEALWELVYADNPFTSEADTQAWLREALDRSEFYTFAIIERSSGTAIGSTRFADIHPEHKKLEIGWTFIAREHWRTHVNSECKYLLLRYAFDELALNRVALKANGKNLRSRDAIAALGAAYEGTHRAFRIHPRTQEVHDVSYYSVLAEEWPAVKHRFEARMNALRTA